MTPIFIHSLWRSGSTYIWNRLRALPEVCAYYEPFHEALGVATREELAPLSPEGWNSRHPRLDKGYYAEYLPLVGQRGVPGFEKAFSVDHFFEDDAVLASERPYITSLIAHAQQQGQVPVLGCCRTLGRAPWLKREFGGTHIVLTRDPRQQWHSGYLSKIESGHAYFEIMPFQVLGKATWDPALRFKRLFGIPTFESDSFFHEHEKYFAMFGSVAFERSYAAFYALLNLSLERAFPDADLVIDIDLLSESPSYRNEVVQSIEAETGLVVSFDDAKITRHDLTRGDQEFRAIERSVEALISVAPPARKRRHA